MTDLFRDMPLSEAALTAALTTWHGEFRYAPYVIHVHPNREARLRRLMARLEAQRREHARRAAGRALVEGIFRHVRNDQK